MNTIKEKQANKIFNRLEGLNNYENVILDKIFLTFKIYYNKELIAKIDTFTEEVCIYNCDIHLKEKSYLYEIIFKALAINEKISIYKDSIFYGNIELMDEMRILFLNSKIR